MALNYDEYEQSLGTLNTNTPLAQRMMEHIPGITASLGFSAFRGSNTLIRGGFLDDATRFKNSRAAMGAYRTGSVARSATTADSFVLGSRRFANKSFAGKDPFLRASRVNNVTMRPRALTRMHSLSAFTAGAQGSGYYTPFQSSRFLNKFEQAGKFGMGGLRESLGVTDKTTPIFGAGLFSAVSAGRKLDVMTRKGKLARLCFR